MLGFVDDIHHYVKSYRQKVTKLLINETETSARSWNKLLHFVGQDLEIDKCSWYIIK